MDKLNDIMASSKNANLLEACGTVFRISVSEQLTTDSRSLSSLSFSAQNGPAASNFLLSLQQVGMFGLANHHRFLPSDRSLPLIKWINELVTRIIE